MCGYRLNDRAELCQYCGTVVSYPGKMAGNRRSRRKNSRQGTKGFPAVVAGIGTFVLAATMIFASAKKHEVYAAPENQRERQIEAIKEEYDYYDEKQGRTSLTPDEQRQMMTILAEFPADEDAQIEYMEKITGGRYSSCEFCYADDVCLTETIDGEDYLICMDCCNQLGIRYSLKL
jgi:hypothetical protein